MSQLGDVIDALKTVTAFKEDLQCHYESNVPFHIWEEMLELRDSVTELERHLEDWVNYLTEIKPTL